MCSCESPGRLKSLSTDLDRSDPLFFTSSKCSRKRSSNLRPDSPNVEFAAESTSDAINDVGHVNGHVLQRLREQLKLPGSRFEGIELLTSEFRSFPSRLNETSGGLGRIGAV